MTIDSKSQSSQNLWKQSRDKTLIKNKQGLPKERSTQISRMKLESKSRSAIKTVLLTKQTLRFRKRGKSQLRNPDKNSTKLNKISHKKPQSKVIPINSRSKKIKNHKKTAIQLPQTQTAISSRMDRNKTNSKTMIQSRIMLQARMNRVPLNKHRLENRHSPLTKKQILMRIALKISQQIESQALNSRQVRQMKKVSKMIKCQSDLKRAKPLLKAQMNRSLKQLTRKTNQQMAIRKHDQIKFKRRKQSKIKGRDQLREPIKQRLKQKQMMYKKTKVGWNSMKKLVHKALTSKT